MPRRPDRTVQKILISTPCHLVGEYETDALLLEHAWPRLHSRRMTRKLGQGPHARTALVAAIATPEDHHGGLVIPNYDHLGDLVCDLMSVLYGKRFDNHGPFEQSGYFGIPEMQAYEIACDPALPQNTSKPRSDFAIALHLEEVRRLAPLLYGEPTDASSAFRVACKFYRQALIAAEDDIEIAYLHHITAGEILSGLVELDADALVDAATRAVLERITHEHPDGPRTARTVRSKLRSIKRRFVAAFEHLTTDDFFTRSESRQFGRLQASGYIKALGAAYDLRSRYLHTGRAFGHWVAPRGDGCEERQSGRPVDPDRAWASTLAAAPTLIGIERIVRYALLRYAEGFGVDLAPAPSAQA